MKVDLDELERLKRKACDTGGMADSIAHCAYLLQHEGALIAELRELRAELARYREQATLPSNQAICPRCKSVVFVRESGTIVSHYNKSEVCCPSSERSFDVETIRLRQCEEP